MTIDATILPVVAAAFLLMFARLGTMVMLLPGLGERSVPVRVRLTVALVLTFMLFPLHRAAYAIDMSLGPLLLLLAQEMAIGAVLGLTARLALSALQIAGTVVANQMGLGFVMQFDPAQGQQGVLVANFMTIVGIAMIFATDMHHLVIGALDHSYRLFRPGELPVTGDVARLMTETVSGAFRIAIQIAAPFLVFGLLFNLGLGVLARLMPQMQVFFVGLPLSILLGFMILAAVLATMMAVFVDHVATVLGALARTP